MGANGLMGSVTRTGGMRTTGSYALQTAVVRDEWGFRGTIITDYYQSSNINDFDEGIRAGNNQVLWPDWRDDVINDKTSDTAKYYIHKSAKDLLYAYADTMFYSETAQGLENGALVGTVTNSGDVFAWWIPALAVLNTIVLCIVLSLLIPKAEPKKVKKDKKIRDDDDDFDNDAFDFDGEIQSGDKVYAVTAKIVVRNEEES
jgi:beta-glucosidase